MIGLLPTQEKYQMVHEKAIDLVVLLQSTH